MTPQELFSSTQALIEEVRRSVAADSRTAHAIDSLAPWEEIAQCAEQEGLTQAAARLYEAASTWWEFEERYG